MIYSSSLLRKVFTKAVSIGRKFRVIIADGRPNFEGKEMARHMINLGLHCTYVLVSSVPYIIHEVSFNIQFLLLTCKKHQVNLFVFCLFLGYQGFCWSSCSSCQWLCDVQSWNFSSSIGGKISQCSSFSLL